MTYSFYTESVKLFKLTLFRVKFFLLTLDAFPEGVSRARKQTGDHNIFLSYKNGGKFTM